MKVKKNSSEARAMLEPDTAFLQHAGAPQRMYEQLRHMALEGDQSGPFELWGMSLLLPEHAGCPVGLWTVTRVRAPIRAGEMALEQLLAQTGICDRLRRSTPSVELKEGLV
jgi:hypothetical protein